ncbi:MAG: energy transducer TonB [Paludibacteraceae bacterium]|nr:energy transducer TonB [Paludibacteraceae bacterium]
MSNKNNNYNLLMTRGKSICEFLKKIRQQIADVNGITYAPAVCTHKGECAGTCPACESEREYIESQLRRKKDTGNPIKIIGLSAALMSGYSYASDSIPSYSIEVGTPKFIAEDISSDKGNDRKAKVVQPAHFPGGDMALHNFLVGNLVYPMVALDHYIDGPVSVTFVVSEDGSIQDIRVTTSADPSLSSEVLRVVEIMPKWRPATFGGQPISSSYHLSVEFKMDPNFRHRILLNGRIRHIDKPSTEKED